MKKKILIVGDSGALHTGFGIVVDHIARMVNDMDVELMTLGWFHKDGLESRPYRITPTASESIEALEKDKYGAESLPPLIQAFKPDVVLAIGDAWMVEPIARLRCSHDFRLILYVPVDGVPLPKRHADILNMADVVVAYGAFGSAMMVEAGTCADKIVRIPHGVDTDIFKPLEKDEIKKIRKSYGWGDGPMITIVGRNQPRKNIPLALKAFSILISDKSICTACGRVTLKSDACPCGGKLSTLNGVSNAKLYLHMAMADVGWNLHELVDRYGLVGKVLNNNRLSIGHGIPTEELAKIVACSDVFTLPTGGEGFGLPIIEAMSCGVPTVVTNYSAHLDYCAGVSELIDVAAFTTDLVNGTDRAVVDVIDYAMRLSRLCREDHSVFAAEWGGMAEMAYNKPMDEIKVGAEARAELGESGRKRAEQYDWKGILPVWRNLINEVIDGKIGKSGKVVTI